MFQYAPIQPNYYCLFKLTPPLLDTERSKCSWLPIAMAAMAMKQYAVYTGPKWIINFMVNNLVEVPLCILPCISIIPR